jgi:8-oxo-dGTP diphosphatase
MKQVHVDVAVIIKQQQVLISLRKPEQHLGGLWEFPGGKVEADETVYQALCREIQEELSLMVHSAQPMMKVQHDYTDKSVLLDVWWVDNFSGTASGQEGQMIKWCDMAELHSYRFPQANQTIVSALQQYSARQA